MKAGRAQQIVLGAWLGMIGLSAARHIADPRTPGLPPPSAFLGSGVLFTALFGAAAVVPALAAAIAVGVDVSLLLRPYFPQGSGVGPLNLVANWLDGISGTQPPGQLSPALAGSPYSGYDPARPPPASPPQPITGKPPTPL